jgi:hypothetical protein
MAAGQFILRRATSACPKATALIFAIGSLAREAIFAKASTTRPCQRLQSSERALIAVEKRPTKAAGRKCWRGKPSRMPVSSAHAARRVRDARPVLGGHGHLPTRDVSFDVRRGRAPDFVVTFGEQAGIGLLSGCAEAADPLGLVFATLDGDGKDITR